MPTIVWFNVPAAETGRARAFYEEVFSWTAEPFPGMEGAFELAAGGIGGEILPQAHPGDPITVFVGVPSVEEYAGRVERAGGRVVVRKRTTRGRGEVRHPTSRITPTRHSAPWSPAARRHRHGAALPHRIPQGR